VCSVLGDVCHGTGGAINSVSQWAMTQLQRLSHQNVAVMTECVLYWVMSAMVQAVMTECVLYWVMSATVQAECVLKRVMSAMVQAVPLTARTAAAAVVAEAATL